MVKIKQGDWKEATKHDKQIKNLQLKPFLSILSTVDLIIFSTMLIVSNMY